MPIATMKTARAGWDQPALIPTSVTKSKPARNLTSCLCSVAGPKIGQLRLDQAAVHAARSDSDTLNKQCKQCKQLDHLDPIAVR